MDTKSVFISFDYDNDQDLRGNLVAQAKNPESPFSITDWSVKEPISENWRRNVRDLIRRADLTIVICGEHTHQAAGVAAEVTIVQEEGKSYFLLKGRRRKTCTRPRSARRRDKIHNWTWPNLKKLIAGTG
ncbi:MAG: hypothetical protein F4X57_11605 [Chloroflexi bacterium]|nr:hypothetical protein [Chloroflexota bacterium]